MKSAIIALSLVSIAGCSQITGSKSPDLFPNEKLASTSPVQARSDVDQCMALADQYVEQPNQYMDLAKQGVIGGAVGAGTGAVAGAITGEAGRGTGAGAAVGGILGVLKGLSEMNERGPSYERFVEHCLHRRGYEVVGWSVKDRMAH